MGLLYIKRFIVTIVGVMLLTPSMARAQCVATEHASTVASVVSNIATNLASTSLWIEFWWVPEVIQPAFANMAKQWTISDMDTMKTISTLMDSKQEEVTKKTIEDLKTRYAVAVQPSEPVCSRISNSSNYLASSFKAKSVNRTLLQNSIAQQTGGLGSPSGSGASAYSRARFDHFINNSCSDSELGGVTDGVCSIADANKVNSDISPVYHFGKYTVEGNDPQGTEGPAHLNAFVENVCGGFTLDVLPSEYFDDFDRQELLLDMYGYWQYQGFCRDSIMSFAAFKAPSDQVMSPYQRATLEEVGMTNDEITLLYGDAPSRQAQMDIMMLTHRNPVSLGIEQMDSENNLYAGDVLNLATDFMLSHEHYNLMVQETRNLALFLSMQLKEQRAKANADLLSVNNNGKKS